MYHLVPATLKDVPKLKKFTQLGNFSLHWDIDALENVVKRSDISKSNGEYYRQDIILLMNRKKGRDKICSFMLCNYPPTHRKINITQFGLTNNLEEDQLNIQACIELLHKRYPRDEIVLKVPLSQSHVLKGLKGKPDIGYDLVKDGYTDFDEDGQVIGAREDAAVAFLKPKLTAHPSTKWLFKQDLNTKIQLAIRKLIDVTGVDWGIGTLKDGNLEPLKISSETFKDITPEHGEFVLYTHSKLKYVEDTACKAMMEIFGGEKHHLPELMVQDIENPRLMISLSNRILNRTILAEAAVGEASDDFILKKAIEPEDYKWRDMTKNEVEKYEKKYRER